jgi:diguanylate cyclase (GGDEF)-like protein
MNDRTDTDPLTGLVSRRGFFDDLHAMIAGSRPLGLVQVDVANVKPLAARSGTAAADKVLVEVGGHLSDLSRRASLVGAYRIGGTEFALLTEGWDDGELAALCRSPLAAPQVTLPSGETVTPELHIAHTTLRSGEDESSFLGRIDQVAGGAIRSRG